MFLLNVVDTGQPDIRTDICIYRVALLLITQSLRMLDCLSVGNLYKGTCSDVIRVGGDEKRGEKRNPQKKDGTVTEFLSLSLSSPRMTSLHITL